MPFSTFFSSFQTIKCPEHDKFDSKSTFLLNSFQNIIYCEFLFFREIITTSEKHLHLIIYNYILIL